MHQRLLKKVPCILEMHDRQKIYFRRILESEERNDSFASLKCYDIRESNIYEELIFAL